MTYATDIMTAAINAAIAEGKVTGYSWPTASVETKAGKLFLRLDVARNANSFAQHSKKSWKLNGKVVSAANLEKALNEA